MKIKTGKRLGFKFQADSDDQDLLAEPLNP
jgi:hypothetical protein